MMKTLLAGTALLLASPLLNAQTIVGLGAGNALVRFSATAPSAVSANLAITGLTAGDTLVGVDVRPSNGLLYGIASSGRLYTIDPASGVATAGAQLNQAMTGTTFGVDFNPVADRLRVVSDTGQSLRINVADGATTIDGAINPSGRIIGEVGYTNSVAGAAATQLFDIDLASSSLLLQDPPNNGTTTLVGALGVTLDAGSPLGFDIRRVGAADTALAALRVGGTTSLYTVNLTTGAATAVGAIGGNPALRGIAVIEAPVLAPLPPTATAIGLRSDNTLVRFPAASPGVTTATTTITGLQGGDSLVGVDFRPANGALYGVARSGRIYVIDPVSGVATAGALVNVALTGNRFAVDFNPVPDRLRVVSDTGQNLRINVADGVAVVDGTINPAGPQVTSGAYTNSFAGAATTVLFDIDAVSGTLFTQNPPNDGTLRAIGPLGVAISGDSGFDILSSGGNNSALAALSVGGSTGLYQINLGSGAASLVGAISGNPALVGLALTPNAIGGPAAVNVPVPVDSRLALVLMAMGLLLVAMFGRRRAR